MDVCSVHGYWRDDVRIRCQVNRTSLFVQSFVYEVHVCVLFSSGINGVKEMEGFRRTFNISYSPGDHVNHSDQCGSEDDVETSALIVSKE